MVKFRHIIIYSFITYNVHYTIHGTIVPHMWLNRTYMVEYIVIIYPTYEDRWHEHAYILPHNITYNIHYTIHGTIEPHVWLNRTYMVGYIVNIYMISWLDTFIY